MDTIECTVMVEIANFPLSDQTYPRTDQVTYLISQSSRTYYPSGRICSHNMQLHKLKWQITFGDRIYPIICKVVIPDIAKMIMLYCCDELFI